LDKKYAFEPSLYVRAQQEVSKDYLWIKIQSVLSLRKSTVNIYENNSPVTFNTDLQIYEKAIPTGTKFYNKNEVIQSYDNLEPRFSASYQLNDAQSIKASYNRMTQYLQLISNTSSYH
jgi:hypothetical protein